MRCYDCSQQIFDFNRFLAEHPNTLDVLIRQEAMRRPCQADISFGICRGTTATGSGCMNTTAAATSCAGASATEEANCCAANFAEFFALMPQDNPAPVAPNTDVAFPHNGSCCGDAITRIDGSSFNLERIGTYQVTFGVSITEAGQLILTLNGGDLTYTAAGKTVGASQIIGMALVTTTAKNSVLTVRNPAGNPTALTATQLAGGTRQTSAHLIILFLD